MASNIDYTLGINEKKFIDALNQIIPKVQNLNKDFSELKRNATATATTFSRAFDQAGGDINAVEDDLKSLSSQSKKTGKDLDATFDIDTQPAEQGVKGLIGNFSQLIAKGRDVKNALASGSSEDIGSSLSGLGGVIKGALNPMTLAVGAAAALGAGLVALGVDAVASAQEINKLKTEISTLTGLTGEDLNTAASGISATAKTFGLEQEQILETINAVAKNRKLSFEEAQKIVTTLAESGVGSEGLKQLREYDIQLKELGITGKESVDIIRLQFAKGIYDDKLTDALKEGGIKLKEFGVAAQDAIKPLGAEFIKKFEQDRLSGAKTGLQLQRELAKRALEVGASEQDLQLLVADLLGGSPGEDVGVRNYINLLANLDAEIEKVNKATETQRKANQDLNESQRLVETQIAKLGDSFSGSGNKLTILKNNVIAFVLTGLNRVIDFVTESKDAITDFFSPVTRFVGRFIDILTVAYEATVGYFQGFLEGSGYIDDVIVPAFNLLKNVVGFVYDNILNFVELILSIPSVIGRAFSFVTGIIDTVRAKIVEFAPALKPVLDALFFGFDQIRKVVSFVADAFDDASSAGQTMGKIFAYLSIPFKALIETISLAVTGARVLGNSIKKLSNDFLGTKFDINPELSAETFTKELSQFKKKAGNFFISPTVKPKLDTKGLTKDSKDLTGQILKDAQKIAEEERDRLKGATQPKTGGGEAEKFEIKITADIKPFLDAVQKARDEIRLIGENEKVKIVQFETAVDEITLRRSQELIERSKLESEQRIAQIQLQTASETALREAEIRRTTQLQALDTQRTEQLKGISELKSVVLQNQKRAELEKAYQIEKAKIESNADFDRLNVENLNNQKRLDLEREQQRQVALLQLRTIQEQQKRIEESLKTQRDKQIQALQVILSDTKLFDQKRELEVTVTLANRADIEKQVKADLQRLDASITEFRAKIQSAQSDNRPRSNAEAQALQRDIEILSNLEKERINVINSANQQILAEEARFIEAQNKITQQELAVRKERFDRQVDQAVNFVGQINASFDKIEDLSQQFRDKLDPSALQRTTNQALLVINSFVGAVRNSLGGFISQIGDIGRVKFEVQGFKDSAEAIDKQIEAIRFQLSAYYAILNDRSSSDAQRENARTQIDALRAQQNALISQRQVLVGNLDELNARLEQNQQSIARAREALRTGVDPDTGSVLDENQKQKAEEALKDLEDQQKDIKDQIESGNSNLENALKQRRKRIVGLVVSIAEVVGNAVFDALKAGTQATIDQLDVLISKQEERISEVSDALKQGGDAAKNFSVEQLEIEEERARKLEEQRASEIEKQQAYTIAQIALNGAIAIARTFAEYPFPLSLGIAAIQGASLFASILALRSQAQAFKAEKGIVDISDQSLTDGKGVIKGKRHSQGGVLIEAEGGETITSRNNTSKYKPLLQAIHEGRITPTQMLEIRKFLEQKKASLLPRKIDIALPKIKQEYSHRAIIERYRESQPNATSHASNELLTEIRGLRRDIKENPTRVTTILDRRGLWQIQEEKHKHDRMRRKTNGK